MREQDTPNKILVVADDFTGANDAGVELALRGALVSVVFDTKNLPAVSSYDVLVINTDSRAVEPTIAAQRTSQAITSWQAAGGQGWIFKKIDSTLRGNLGVEITAALLAADVTLALVVPAAPALGRVTRQGLCLVNGQLLTETEFSTDPKTPLNSARISERLSQQSELKIAEIHLTEIRQPDLAMRLQQQAEEGIRLLVLDAESPDDLQLIMAAAAKLPFRPLLAGAGGLSDALARQQAFLPVNRGLLAVVGSMSKIAQHQISSTLQRNNVTLVDIDIEQLFQQPEAILIDRWSQDVAAVLAQGYHCVIRSCCDQQQRRGIEQLCQQQSINRQQLGDHISRFLGTLTAAVVSRQIPGGLYLSGGDIAMAAAAALGARSFQIKGQIASCVPWGKFLQSTVGEIPVMTKAGGFGDEATLCEVLDFIEERWRE